jgi:hypothetical protein
MQFNKTASFQYIYCAGDLALHDPGLGILIRPLVAELRAHFHIDHRPRRPSAPSSGKQSILPLALYLGP